MKKAMVFIIAALLLVSLVLAKAEVNKEMEQNADGSITITQTVTNQNQEKVMTKTITRSCDDDNSTSCTKNMEKTMTIERTRDNKTFIISKNISVKTELEIEVDEENNRTYVDFHGYKKEVKIMPDTASERALERLRLKVCNESNNCTITLKDVGNNQTEMQYELQVERHYKLLGMFKTKAQVRAEIGAESGNVTITKNPWWAFLATQQDN